MIRTTSALALAATLAFGQARIVKQGAYRMEITLERLEGGKWRAVDPGLVLDQGDRVRFRYRTNFDGYLFVSNMGTSGKYEFLFPHAETGGDNHVLAATEYQVPATANTVFRISGPAGHDLVYFIVNPNKGGFIGSVPSTGQPKAGLIPRCDDSILRARGDCVDSSAGPKPGEGARDLVFMREGQETVISSPTPLQGPVSFVFRLAHK